MIAGRPPFDSKHIPNLLLQHTQTKPPKLSDFVRVSREIDAILVKALEKDPKKRFHSTREFAREFHRTVAREKLESKIPCPVTRAALRGLRTASLSEKVVVMATCMIILLVKIQFGS